MRPLPGPGLVTRVLSRPLPYSRRPMPLHDRSQDPGLFGPESVTWQVMREPLLILGAGRALLMQAAHPLVAQGAIDHSAFATDPFGRLERTIEWVTLVCFGTTAEAHEISQRVLRVHRRIAGEIPEENATPSVRPGRAYSAANPALLRWVHASFVDAMLSSHDALVGGLSDTERDRFVLEWDAVAALMGVPARLLWPDARSMRAYVLRQVARGPAVPGAGSRQVATTVLHPPVGSPMMRPGFELLAFISTGLLPAEVRRGYGFSWTPAHTAAHRACLVSVRSLRRVLPRRFRVSPVYDLALARAQGHWPAAAAA
ncbi:MAG TPA: oxygenase MpaB family protein [Candidatus Acidoferrales bacterium]|nr:oxygenase MpaB family protein [Candidatus Acidoferrales bacterium]